jgi:hypothetical protein
MIQLKQKITMKNILLYTFLLLNVYAFTQVKIGNNPGSINDASILEMEDPRGFSSSSTL